MENVKDFYNKYSYPDTNQYTNRQKKKTSKILKKILSLANINNLEKDLKNKRILVAGCGTGEKVKLLVENNLSVVAIDFSKSQLNKAKASIDSKYNKVLFFQKDIVNEDLFSLGKFDLILCLGVLHHSEDAKKGFFKLTSLLNKEGVIIIGLYHKYARIRYRIMRFLLRVVISKDPDKLFLWLSKYQDRLFFLKASLPVLLDRYAVPYESYHTLKEVKSWFLKDYIKYMNSSENVKGYEILKIFERKTIFFVAGKKSS
jgi:SAM-dependent methyltransferase